MTDEPQGHGWWQASDLKWYPPEKRPDPAPLPPPPTADAAQQQPADSTLAATPTPQQGRKPATTRQVIERDRLGVLSKIGQGGQGVVYGAPNVKTKFAASMVYKEYKAQARTDIDFTALAAMPALVEESLSYSQGERLISFAAWPCAIIEDAGTPTGFVMPAIPDEFFIPLTTVKGVSTTTAEFQHLLNHASVLAARGITLDDAQRYTLLRETASALVFLHKHRVCVGDISPKNLLFCLTPHEAVYFIDCDAMRINTVSALPQVETPGWNAPPGEELATIYTDTYKLGLLALRLLTGDHDITNPQHIPPTTPTQLRQIITDTLTNPPHQRPIPEAWTSVLGNAIEQAQHHKKTTPPVSTAPAPPPIPVVHSRPTPLDDQAPPPAAPAPAPQRPPDDSASSSPQPAAPKRPLVRVATVVPALLAIVLVATAAFATIETVRTNRLASRTVPTWQPYVDAAKTIAVDLTTINYQTADSDIQRILDNSTGTFHDDFSKRSEPFKQVVRQAQSASSGTVSGAGLESVDGTKARVLVAVSIKTTNAGKPEQEPKEWRMRISVDKIGQSYKASKTEFVS
jgi:serine/threonine protein kinase